MNWANYNSASAGCTGGPSKGAIALRDFLLSEYSIASSGGIYNCRNVRGRTTPSIHGEGRAWDMMLPVRAGRGNPVGHDVVRRLGAHGRALGIQSIIFDRTIWSSRSPSGRAYTGAHPHYDHLHIELTLDAATKLTVARLRAVLGTKPAVSVVKPARPVLRQGDRGEHVKVLQRNLGGLTADGIFGPKTTDAVRKFQRSKKLTADGIVGPKTWAALGL
jgi:hypothetical protein